MPKLPTNVKVSTADTELQFAIQNKTTGRALFDQVISATGLREVWYFGIHFIDQRNQPGWLNLEKKIMQQGVKKDGLLKFDFKFKTFPENVVDEVIQDSTLKLLYLQVKEEILNEGIYCPAEKCVLLASYQVQAKYLDYNTEEHAPGYLANDKLLPKTIIDQHKLSMEEWEEKISAFHKQHLATSREEAMVEYLKIAQDLEMFGISYFPVRNDKGTDVLLGVDALGINIYEKSNKLAPKISFPWSEIKKITPKNDKFKIALNDKNSQAFVVTTVEPKSAKKIQDMSDSNHQMYIRRRRPDGLEVQQMKAQKKEEAKNRAKEREALKREIRAREEMEKSREETLVKYKALQEEMVKYKDDLDEARRTIDELEKQLRETQDARKELEVQQEELKELMTKYQADRSLELEERQKLEEEIRIRQEEIERVRSSVEEKDEETKRLQDEMAEAKKQLELTTLSMSQKMNEASRATEVAIEQNGKAGEDDSSSTSSDSDHEALDETAKGDEERDIDETKQELLKELRANLEATKDETKITVADKQYQVLAEQGRDKFKTLRDIRSGNTKRRIDNFENM